MRNSNHIVEQIDIIGNIVMDYSEILSPKELKEIVTENFECTIADDGFAYGSYNDKKYCLCFKNISYLGKPHPVYKKRIQIPASFLEAYRRNEKNNIKTFFIGIYKYKENIVFVNFKTDKYIQNKAHNSSAHVLAIDLAYAAVQGFHIKKDARENEIFCFDTKAINYFYEMYVSESVDNTPQIFKIFNEFYDGLKQNWNGIDCYKNMMNSSYHRSNQSEWPGAYLEYEFENYLELNPEIKGIVTYAPVRGTDGIDLDLYFPALQEYGDLKAHTNTTSAIIGNKTSTIEKCIKGNNSIFYIVFNHDSTYDKEYDYEVTKFWNSSLHKDNLLSYCNRMKHDITLTSYMILEINEKNYRYLKTDFQANFKNSDGNKRSGKISIAKSKLPNFIIHEYTNNR